MQSQIKGRGDTAPARSETPCALVNPAELCRRFGLRPYSVRAVVHCAPLTHRWCAGRPLVNTREFANALTRCGMARDTQATKKGPGDVTRRGPEVPRMCLTGTRNTR